MEPPQLLVRHSGGTMEDRSRHCKTHADGFVASYPVQQARRRRLRQAVGTNGTPRQLVLARHPGTRAVTSKMTRLDGRLYV